MYSGALNTTPETDPIMSPASLLPVDCQQGGDDPQVEITVTRATPFPTLCQATAWIERIYV